MENLNLDSTEIDKFDALYEEWWNPVGKLKTLHTLNPIRLGYVRQSVNLSGKDVLDIGCGGGLLTEAMAKEGANVTGLDASKLAIEVANEHQKKELLAENYLPVVYHHGTAEEFSRENISQFDVITCMELLEHVPDPTSLLASCAIMLKPQGHIFLSTINRNIKSYTAAILSAEYLLGLLPKGTHDYKSFIRPSELSTWLRHSNFKVLDISGMTYIPGIEECKLTNSPDVNYLQHAQLEGR